MGEEGKELRSFQGLRNPFASNRVFSGQKHFHFVVAISVPSQPSGGGSAEKVVQRVR